jgi:hypothetical protein
MDRTQYKEIWVEADDGQTMCALINGDVGWLMYLRSPEDAGFSSRNPTYSGSPDEMLEYFLDNGQRDEYPLSWAIPVADVHRALEYFKTNSAPPKFVTWHNDSGDGTEIGG